MSDSNGTQTPIETEGVVVRFAGDSGDGMQLTGSEFTKGSAIAGNDIATFPDFPAEIRAPAGTLAGVSGFQVHFSSNEVSTPGDQPDVLVAMNPAALKANVADLVTGGILIVNSDNFSKGNLDKAGYTESPLDNDSLTDYQVFQVGMNKNVAAALKETGLGSKDVARCKNFYALGLMYWLYNWPTERVLESIAAKFAKKAILVEANTLAFKAGNAYGETAELFASTYKVPAAEISPGTYRTITGNEALVCGLVASAKLSDTQVFLGSYPITPASDILHGLSRYKHFNVVTFQAEDEIAAVGAAIGASYGGSIGVTTTSGPGIALKSEAISLAIMAELPLVVIDVQRGGPSTGLPTKTEQADLLQALYGRHGEAPVVVIAPATPSECFYAAIDAVRLTTKYMVPVFILSDGYLANGADRWRIPKASSLEPIQVSYRTDPEGFLPYTRDPDTLARPWAIPGTPGLEHRIGGLEKEDQTGNVSYDPLNHQKMTKLRAEKVARVAQELEPCSVDGPDSGELLLVGWGSTYGSLYQANRRLQAQGRKVAHLHLRNLNPFPPGLEDVLKSYDNVLVCELNMGQLRSVLRSEFLIDAKGLNKVQGKPFRISEILEAAGALLGPAESENAQPVATA